MTSIAEDLAPAGVLRAAINLGNPVLAQGTPAAPSGVTVDLAREIGARLGLVVDLVCFDSARKSYQRTGFGSPGEPEEVVPDVVDGDAREHGDLLPAQTL